MDRFKKSPEEYLRSTSTQNHNSVVTEYTCPMHPEIRSTSSGSCPKCGMALEPIRVSSPGTKTEWTCPMHPEIIRSEPGNCPICGMALEPKKAVPDKEEDNPELRDMQSRFRVSAILSIPLLFIAMAHSFTADQTGIINPAYQKWIELLLASPVVLWGGWPFFIRGWNSL
jgi:Cu+-exporting ATPase